MHDVAYLVFSPVSKLRENILYYNYILCQTYP